MVVTPFNSGKGLQLSCGVPTGVDVAVGAGDAQLTAVTDGVPLVLGGSVVGAAASKLGRRVTEVLARGAAQLIQGEGFGTVAGIGVAIDASIAVINKRLVDAVGA